MGASAAFLWEGQEGLWAGQGEGTQAFGGMHTLISGELWKCHMYTEPMHTERYRQHAHTGRQERQGDQQKHHACIHLKQSKKSVRGKIIKETCSIHKVKKNICSQKKVKMVHYGA